MIIAIDFDGTLHDGQWPAIGEPLPDAVEMMRRLYADTHEIVIWSCREDKEQADMVNWLRTQGIPFDRVNDNSIEQVVVYEKTNSRKVFADVYIDDRNLGGLPTWREIYDIISGKVKPVWHYEIENA
jgi:hypothetical protein